MNACMVKCIGNNFVLKLSNIVGLHFTCRCIAFRFCIWTRVIEVN